MPHWRTLTDSKWLIAAHLLGKDVTVTIEKVIAGEVIGEAGRTAKKPVVYFRGKKLPLALANTNAKTIAGMYGNNTEGWLGKRITLYPTTTKLGGDMVECIRIRPTIPRGADSAPDPAPPKEEEPSDPPPPDEVGR